MTNRFYSFFWLLTLLLPFNATLTAQTLKVITRQHQLPVLINKPNNPILDITCYNNKDSARIRAFTFRFHGTTHLQDIEKITLRSGRNILAEKIVNGKNKITLPVNCVLADTTHFTVTCNLKPTTDLSHFVGIQCFSVLTEKGKTTPINVTPHIRFRTGIAVRQHRQDGVDTHRIPGLTTTQAGTLLAIYDARWDNSRDLQGNMDIGVSRSTDKGQTWEPMRIALDMKEWGGLPEKFNGVSDACILTNRNNGKIYIAGLWMHGILNNKGQWIEDLTADSNNWQHQWAGKGSQPGLSEKETSQFLITESSDDGQTWSAPHNITAATKPSGWWLFAPAPGCGITLQDHTLVFPTQGRDTAGIPFSNITYSRDGGITWHTSAPAYTNTTECAVAQLSDGSLMLNMRDNRNGREKSDRNGRAIFTTTDLGKNWQEHPSSHGGLPEPVCMASLLRHEYTEKGQKKSILLFSNPHSRYSRNNMTLQVSFNDGKSWCEQNILLDSGNSFGYSCLTSIDENTIGILYESSRAQIVFQQIQLSEILSCRK